MALPQPMSVLMPTMAVMMVVVVVVEILDPDQPRPAAIIFLGPGSVDLARRIGVARTRCFGTGRETGQQDE
jgi:hypothetical protein